MSNGHVIVPLAPAQSARPLWHPLLRLVGGTALGQMIAFATLPLLTRLYSPSEFSELGIVLAFVGILLPVVTLNFHLVIVSADRARHAGDLSRLCLACAVPGCVLAGLLLWLAHCQGWLGTQHLTPLTLWAAPLCLLGCATATVYRQNVVRQDRFSQLGRALVVWNVVRTAGMLMLGVLGFGGVGLVCGEAFGHFFNATQLRRISHGALHPLGSARRSLTRARLVARRYRTCATESLPGTLLNSLGTLLPIPLVVAAYGLECGGHFLMAQRLVAIPIALLGRNISEVFHHRLTAEKISAGGRPRRLLTWTTSRLFVLSAGITVVIIPLGFIVTPWLLSNNWNQAGVYLSILAPGAMAGLIVSPCSSAILVFRAFRLKLVYGTICIGNSCIAFILVPACGATPTVAMAIFSGLTALSYAFYYLQLLRITPPCSIARIPPTSRVH